MPLFAAGMGLLFVPLTVLAVSGVQRDESGAAPSLLNVMQQGVKGADSPMPTPRLASHQADGDES